MILVTGATGFIGRSLMPRLEQAGFSARAYQGRMNDPIRLRAELDGITTVIHLAGSEARGRDRLLHHVDVEQFAHAAAGACGASALPAGLVPTPPVCTRCSRPKERSSG